MKDFNEFRKFLSPDKMKLMIKDASSSSGKFGHAEQVILLLMILEEYHKWLNDIHSI